MILQENGKLFELSQRILVEWWVFWSVLRPAFAILRQASSFAQGYGGHSRWTRRM